VKSIQLVGLEAATTYSVFCVARSVNTLLLTGYLEVLAQNVTIATPGRKAIIFEMMSNILFERSLTIRFLRIYATASPQNVSIGVFCRILDSNFEEFPQPMIYIDMASWSDALEIGLQPLAPGNYTLVIDLVNDVPGAFEAVFPFGNDFEIANPVPLIPTLKACVFAPDGLSVLIEFNQNVEIVGEVNIVLLQYPLYFDCSLLLDFQGVVESTCFWRDSATAVMLPNSVEHLAVGDNITILGGVLRSACPHNKSECEMWPTLPMTLSPLLPPDAPVVPNVIISSPLFIGFCGYFSLGLGLTTGAAGKDWDTVEVSFFNTSGQFSTAALIDILTITDGVLQPFDIPVSIFTPAAWYTIKVEMCNVFGSCGKMFRPLYVYPDPIPAVEILGAKLLKVPAHSALSLTAVYDISSCSGGLQSTYPDIEFSWCVNKNYTMYSDIISTSVDPVIFKIPPYTLDAGEIYNIDVMVRVGNISSYDTVVVMVEPPELMAVISGPEKRSFQVGQRLVLDASESFVNNIDFSPSSKITPNNFSYTWDCRVLKPIYNASCGEFINSSTFGAMWNVQKSVEFFKSESSALDSGQELEVRVRVSDGEHVGYAKSWLHIVMDSSPAIFLTSISPVFNPSEKIVVYGTVDLRTHFTEDLIVNVSYDIKEFPYDISSLAMSKTVRGLSLGKVHNLNFVIKREALPARFDPYMVTLAASGSDAFSSISIRVNQPPVSGRFVVTPATGIAVQTQFRFSATIWEDLNNDLPLSYEFGFISVAGTSTALRRERELNSARLLLPRGHRGSDFNELKTYVLVFDSQGAHSQRNFAVAVFTAFDHDLKSIYASSQVVNIDTSTSLLLSAMMNGVACSLSPQCSALLRDECSTVNQTCGECLKGSIGDVGHHNSACISSSEYFDFVNQEHVGCTSHDNCSSWNYCSDEAICRRRQKPCINDCSKNGNCTFVNINTGSPVSECFLGDASCSAECSCSSEFIGLDCSELMADAELKQLTTLNLLLSFENSIMRAEPDANSFTYWVSILEVLIYTPHILSRRSFLKALDIFEYALKKAEELELHVTEDDMQRVSGVLDVMLQSVLSRQIYVPLEASQCPDEALLRFSDSFKNFQLLLLNRMVEGEDVMLFRAETFRSSTRHTTQGDWVALEIPLTPLSVISEEKETASNYPPSLATNMSNALAVFSFKSRIYGDCAESFIANPVHVVLDHRVMLLNVDSSTVSTSLTLPNNIQQNFPLPEVDTIFKTNCVTGDFNSYNYTCFVSPTQNVTVTHTCRGASTLLTSPCPTVYVEPECLIIDGADTLFSCSVTSFTLEATNCNCHTIVPVDQRLMAIDFSTQNLQAVANTYDLRLVTILHTVVEDLQVETATIKYIPLVETSYFSVQSLSTCFVIVALFLLYSIRQDHVCNYVEGASNFKFVDKAKRESDIVSEEKRHSRSKAGQDLALYLSSLLPSIFKNSMSLWDRCYCELSQHHQYLAGLKNYDGTVFGSACASSSPLTIFTLKILVVESFALALLMVLCSIQVMSVLSFLIVIVDLIVFVF
jgi:hypothetical protein